MKSLLLHNWHLKLISLALAAVLWAAVANSPTSEIGVSVSLEYQNIPEAAEVYGDTDMAEVRLRGPSSVLRTVTPQDISLGIDMTPITLGHETVLSLTPEMVHVPFGAEVVRVVPARVRLTMERTAKKSVPIHPALRGVPAKGFQLDEARAIPETVSIEGPESHIREIEEISTTIVDLDGKAQPFSEPVELDILDPVVRIPKPAPVHVEVQIGPGSR